MTKYEFTRLIIEKIELEKEKIKEQWFNPEGTPTRHFVLDDLLPESICQQIYDAFPKDANGFYSRESFREKKRTSASLDQYAPILGEITYAIQSNEVVNMISDLIGITKFKPDPSLYAGGLSMMFKGDFLNPHIDNSHDAERKCYRRLNLLYYVSPGWKMENGGNFELWDEKKLVPKTMISKFNRLVVMETNKISWHSVSPVVADAARCCVSNYFFSEESPDKTEYFRTTRGNRKANHWGD